jgi:hypothetical protein
MNSDCLKLTTYFGERDRTEGEQKTFGEQGVPLVARVFAAWRAYLHKHHDRDRLQVEIT